MVIDDTIHLTCHHDVKNTIWRSILASWNFIIDIDNDIFGCHMARSEDLQNRYLDVRQETYGEGDFEVDKVLLKVQVYRYK